MMIEIYKDIVTQFNFKTGMLPHLINDFGFDYHDKIDVVKSLGMIMEAEMKVEKKINDRDERLEKEKQERERKRKEDN